MQQYALPLKVVHFCVAFLVLGLLALGLYMKGVQVIEDLIFYYNLHKSLGVLLLGLMIVRIFMRKIFGAPANLDGHSDLELNLARLVHFAFYALLVAMPFSGWLMSNAAGFSVEFFGVFALPDLLGKDDELMVILQDVHFSVGVALFAIILLHVIGLVKHHFFDRDETLSRMTSSKLNASLGSGVIAAVFFVLLIVAYLWVSGLGVHNDTHGDAHGAAHEAADGDTHEAALDEEERGIHSKN
ncbi:cytochrome b [Pseudophaeobacter sp. 1A16562]|uniref:cytochrome b n=1 Tax=Pseudophaeobacter sp. 1A16562 TaxID=3098143 RepID=UPI0034D52733